MLSNYTDLLEALQDWPDLKGEPDLTARAADLISLAEARIGRDLRLQGHITTLIGAEENGPYETYDLPDDFNVMDRLEGPETYGLEQRPAAELARLGTPPSDPCFYAIDGRRLLFVPSVASFTMRYYKQLPALESVGTHWLFAKAPDLFLFASLVEAGKFHKEAEQEFSRYEDAYQKIASALINEDWYAQYSQSQPLRSVTGRPGYRAAG